MDDSLQELMASLPWWGLALAVVVCLAVLGKGADWLVKEAVSLSEKSGIPKVIIGATIVSLGTTVPEAAVSTPLKWSEVTHKLDIRKHTIRSVPKRMKRLEGGDPLVGVLDDKPDLAGALDRLSRRSLE